MIGFLKTVLVFVVSIQIACTGSANPSSPFLNKNPSKVIKRQQLGLDLFKFHRQLLTYAFATADKHHLSLFPFSNPGFMQRSVHQHPLAADRDSRYQSANTNLVRANQTPQNIKSANTKEMIKVSIDTGVSNTDDMLLYSGSSGTEEPINSDKDSGFMANNAELDDLSDFNLSRVGDINGDGFNELMITDGKVAFVIYGSERDRSQQNIPLDVNNFTEASGFKIQFYNEDYRISAISGAGKINSDDLDDIIIGVANADNESGASYVLYGQHEKISGPITLSEDYMSSDLGFIIKGATAGDKSGSSVTGAGDINCDGFDDVIVEAPGAINGVSTTGASYLVYGQENNPEVIYLRSFYTLHYAGFMMTGVAKVGNRGYHVTDAADINGDDCDDLIISRSYAKSGDNNDGGVDYVVYGIEDGFGNINFEASDYLANIDIPIFQLNALSASSLTNVDSDTNLNPSSFKVGSVSYLELNEVGAGDEVEVGDEVEAGIDDVEITTEPRVMVDFKTISLAKDHYGREVISFNKSATNSHYIQLDHKQFNGLEQFTIQIDFILDFKRDYTTIQHAYLVSLATKNGDNKVRDNMLSIYLKDRNNEYLYSTGGRSGRWDLSVVLEDEGNKEHQVFLHKDWISTGRPVPLTLTVAVNLSTKPQTIKVYRNDSFSPTHGHTHLHDQKVVINHIKKSENESVHQFTTDITELTVDPQGAFFGNDQDKVGGDFNQQQAFEGKLYGIRIYDKMFDPRETYGDEYLRYSVSKDNIVFNH